MKFIWLNADLVNNSATLITWAPKFASCLLPGGPVKTLPAFKRSRINLLSLFSTLAEVFMQPNSLKYNVLQLVKR